MKGLKFFFFTVIYLISNIGFSFLTLAQQSDKENCRKSSDTASEVVTTGTFNSDECLTVLEQAKQNLPEDYFIAYAIVDRIARANRLYKKPWRIIIQPDSAVAASSEYNSDYNLIALNQSVLDVLEPSEIACIIGREMGHNVKQHLGYGLPEEEQAKLEELEETLYKQEKEKVIAQLDQETQNIFLGTPSDTIGAGSFGEIIRGSGNIVSPSRKKIEAQIEQQTQERLSEKIIEINQKQELQADELGYLYSVTAGFDANGCQNAMNILQNQTNPILGQNLNISVEERNENIDNLKAKYDPETLKSTGQIYLTNSDQNLLYEVFSAQVEEGQSISGVKVLPSNTVNSIKKDF